MSGALYSDLSTPVAVALCSYNGASYIEQQLASILAQRYPCKVHVFDDASTDDTVARVSAMLRPGLDVLHVQQANKGYVRNFEDALTRLLDQSSGYIALSDQDDLWSTDRLASGMAAMASLEQQHGSEAPLLVHSDLSMIDASGKTLQASFLAFRRYRIRSERALPVVLGENGIMGNTVLMNRSLAALCLPFPAGLHVHDYWIALMAELFGHRTLLRQPSVLYRLHDHNASNTRQSMRAGFEKLGLSRRLRSLLKRDFKLPFKEDTRLQALEYLLNNRERFPPLSSEQLAAIQAFVRYLHFEQPRLASMAYLIRSGAVRPNLLHRARLCAVTLLTTRYQ